MISLAYPAIFYPNTLDAFALAPQFVIAHASKREEIRSTVRDVVLQLASASRVASTPGAGLQFMTRQSLWQLHCMVICNPSGIAIHLHHMTIDGATEVSLQFGIIFYRVTTFFYGVSYLKTGCENLTMGQVHFGVITIRSFHNLRHFLWL